jgi:hypothetical protein
MRVGSYVICIDGKFSPEQLEILSNIPKEGDYYTIRDIVEYPEMNRIGLRLEEISCNHVERNDGAMHEPTFSIFRFRELDVPPSLEAEIKESLNQEFETIESDEDDGLFRKIHNKTD